MIKCTLCPTESEGFYCIDDLEAHIAAEHYDCVPFECEKCRFSKFPTEFAIKRHFEEVHGISEYYIRYKVSRQIAEKLAKVRRCLEQSCSSSGIELPNFCNFTLLTSCWDDHRNTGNNIQSNDSNNEHTPTSTSNCENRRNTSDGLITGQAPGFENIMKSENLHFQNNSGLIENNSNDDAASALAAFILNANSEGFVNTGDSNNNKLDSDVQCTENNLNSFYTKLLTPINNFCTSTDNFSRINENEEIGGDFIDDPQQQAQKLLRRIESHISTQSDSSLMNKRKKRQAIKKFGIIPKMKKRFYLQNELGDIFNDSQTILSNSPNHDLSCKGEYNDYNFRQSMGECSLSNANSILKINEIQCQQCKEMVTNRATSLNYHVNMKHLKFPLFVCKGCDKKFLWQRTTIVTHVQRYHNGDESLIQDNSSQYMSLINLRRKAFFPPKFALATAAAAAAAAAVPAMDSFNEGNSSESHILPSSSIQAITPSTGDILTENLHNFNLSPDENLDLLNGLPNGIENLCGDDNVDISSVLSDEALVDADFLSNAIIENEIKPRKNNGIKLKCGDCQKMILANKQWILLNHINSEHMHLPLFECGACKQIFTKYLRSYVFVHVKKYHNGDEHLVIDNRPMFLEILQEKCFELFNVRLSN